MDLLLTRGAPRAHKCDQEWLLARGCFVCVVVCCQMLVRVRADPASIYGVDDKVYPMYEHKGLAVSVV